ncbi:hypothetical protein [Marinimicrobium alkaliphilum]|nr:hypothetical protein [Marinimicrobium alkaliphilum]
MTEEFESHQESPDTIADAVAAVALIAVFVATCIFWIASQGA